MQLDRKYLVCALSYALAGMGMGMFMAASHNFAQHVTHAHILLVGFVASLIYGVIHKLWLANNQPLGTAQFIVHQVGAAAMCIGLFLLFGNIIPAAQIELLLAVGSATVLLGVFLMLYMVFRSEVAELQLPKKH